VLKDGVPLLALGTGGSNRIRTALLQVLVHHLLRKMPLEVAVRHPRMHYEGGPLFIERAVFGQQVSAETLALLTKRVPKLVPFDAPNMFFGGVHVANSQGEGVGDPRRGGSVAYSK
jgi:gamma-glutamyltranspeptidase/glutathione hydrolase